MQKFSEKMHKEGHFFFIYLFFFILGSYKINHGAWISLTSYLMVVLISIVIIFL